MIVTSMFLLSLMCTYMPCDKKHGDPRIVDDFETSGSSHHPKQVRFTRSGPTNFNQISDGEQQERDPIIETKLGVVEGYRMRAINGRRLFAFEGIPYAEPPVGNLRFRNPVPKRAWFNLRKVKEPGAMCLQYHVRKLVPITGSEDCLTLSIYTPGLPSEFKGKPYNPSYPTIVFIHGGGYFFGSGNEYGPSYMAASEEVILVTVNFRQGLLGFLSTGDENSPGNYGLKDQALALKFVSENIANFGGDPKRITLMGQSTGGTSVHLHMMSPLSKNLFNSAISSSGTALNHWAINTEARSLRLTRRLAENVGCPTTSGSRVLMDCFRASNPYFLLHQQQRLYDFATFPPILFAPVVERIAPDAFLPDSPANMYATNQVARKPWICTQTTDEGEVFALAFKHVGGIPFYHSNFDRFAPMVLDYWYTARNSSEVTTKIRNVYFGSSGPLPTDSTIRTISELVSDRYFRVGIHRAIKMHSRIAPTYASLFGFQSSAGFPSLGRGGNMSKDNGVGHSSDIKYYFNSSFNYEPLKMGTPDYDMSRMLINLVANFARDREPYANKNGNIVRMWKVANSHRDGTQRYLLIDNQNVIMIPEPRLYAIKFWESLGLPDTPQTSTTPAATESSDAEPQQQHNVQSHQHNIYVPPPPLTPESLKVQAVPPPFDPNFNNNMYSYNTDIKPDFSQHIYTYSHPTHY